MCIEFEFGMSISLFMKIIHVADNNSDTFAFLQPIRHRTVDYIDAIYFLGKYAYSLMNNILTESNTLNGIVLSY